MLKQTVIWTALPNGITGTTLHCSIFVSPRLETDDTPPTLAGFPDWQDWPATKLKLRLEFGTGESLAASIVSAAPSSSLWGAIFSPATFVRSHTFNSLDDRHIRSYPVTNVVAFIKSRYLALASDPGSATDYPSVQTLL